MTPDADAAAPEAGRRFRLTLAQIGPVVGDVAGNAERAVAAWEAGRDAGADMVALPEMFLAGYQPQDLVLKPAFLAACAGALEDLAARCAEGPALGVGVPVADPGGVSNAYAVLSGGAVRAIFRKHHLPNYGVFDEKRLYHAADPQGPVTVGPLRLGLMAAIGAGAALVKLAA